MTEPSEQDVESLELSTDSLSDILPGKLLEPNACIASLLSFLTLPNYINFRIKHQRSLSCVIFVCFKVFVKGGQLFADFLMKFEKKSVL